jgi:hypothetical protein
MTTWTRWRRRLAQGVVLLGSWLLVQVPAKDIRIDDPGGNQPPITQFKVVREFASAGECEAYRDFALQSAADEGSQAMLDQSSQLRCVAAAALTPSPATPPATIPPAP